MIKIKYPKWSIKYLILSYSMIIIGVILAFYGVHPVWENDLPHIIQFTSNALLLFGLSLLILLIGYLLGATKATELLKKEPPQ